MPSLRRSLLGLTFMILVVVAGFAALMLGGRSAVQEDEDVFVRYRRSGGFTGETAALVVRDGGAARATFERGGEERERSFELSGADMEALEEVFVDAPWPEVSQILPPPEAAADIFQYDLEFEGVSVRSYDPLPPRVRPVVLYLERRVLPKAFSAFR